MCLESATSPQKIGAVTQPRHDVSSDQFFCNIKQLKDFFSLDTFFKTDIRDIKRC